MGKRFDFNYIIIGSGPAGSAVAFELAKSRQKVALVEGRFFGGSNLNTRDIPYDVALDFSHTFNKLNCYPEVSGQDLHFNFPTIPAHQLKTIISVGGNDKKIFEDAKITCIKGYANFLDKHTIAVNEKRYTAEYFIIATGSSLKTLEISGTDTVHYFTPETAIRIKQPPKYAAIVGGGSTGCEIAEYYAELGIKTLILETQEHLLPREDKEAGEVLANYFTNRLGITVLLNSKVVAIEEDSLSKRIIFRHENSEKLVRVDSIVLATGSQPNLDLGLENAGVNYKNTGIIVDKYFTTSAKNIYAIGDCLGYDSSTERAHQEGLALAANIVGRTKNLLNYSGFTRLTETMPEVAAVGLNEYDLLKRDRKYNKAIVKLNQVTASKIHNFDFGFVKLITDKSHHLIGATIVAPNAGLIASELALAIRHNLTALELASTPHIMNSYNYAIKLAAKELLKKK
ncbi:NAD(P)/FAD-dependent oxidoreductase [Candidatus Saccharibacteria bacterium]|nr:NAD(P)/FAD-dependent oxidoreductase [Candidatus Saccharibacteria bacterium]